MFMLKIFLVYSLRYIKHAYENHFWFTHLKTPVLAKERKFSYWDLRKWTEKLPNPIKINMSYKDINNSFTKCNSALHNEILNRHFLSILHQKIPLGRFKESTRLWNWLVCIGFCFMLLIFVYCVQADILREKEKETQTLYESLTRTVI
jgi:hypothetical protein